MNITMTITADTPVELFSTIKGCNAMIAAECPVATPDKPETGKPETDKPATAAPAVPRAPVQSMPATPTPAPIPMPPVGQTAPVAMPVPPASPPAAAAPTAPMPTAPLADPPKFTIDEVAKAGGEFAQAGHRQELVNLLQQFGVQAVTQLRPEQIGPFATALRGLGAKI